MTTSYHIKHNGHTFWTTDTDTAQQYAQQGATVKARTSEFDPEERGIPINRLREEQLNNLETMADNAGWGEVKQMTRAQMQRNRGLDQ